MNLHLYCSLFFPLALKPLWTRLMVMVLLSVSQFSHAQTLHNVSEAELETLKKAVIKIYTTQAAPDYFTPWSLLNPGQGSGSGTVIAGQRILTNAHVVANARYIQVQKHDDPKKYLAHVAFVSHEADLALIEVEDTSFFKGLVPLSFGKLPEPLQEVSVFGYPFGGKSLSITRGILSRVEHQFYAHAGSYLLAGQLDAAINPGNSGGPVIQDQKIVGVVMQSNNSSRAENLGYFVPPSVIQHVLQDAKDGKYDGFPDLGFRTQGLESPAMKKAYGLSNDKSGMVVTKVFAESAAEGIIKEGDLILSINGLTIADDRSVEFRRYQRTNYKFVLDQFHQGDKIPFQLLRNGKQIDVTVTAKPLAFAPVLTLPEAFDELPEYYIYGGVVFVPLNMNLIKRWGHNWNNKAPVQFLNARDTWSTPEHQEQVVALKVLAADVNLGYHDWKNWLVARVNGQPIVNFRQFCEVLENNNDTFVSLEDEQGYRMVIDHAMAKATQDDILQRYQIPSAYSPALFEK